ncbi:MAG: DeoR/GlpR transcriptional regulator [Flavipsychrobacter sp.]|nr:DeoR/GlpR transcriptional regulator [Flavipsychrobacter sp.]
MLKKERQAYILQKINLHNKILSGVISEEMSVSQDTIRRDLAELEQVGKVIKVHGGAMSPSFHYQTWSFDDIYARDAKKEIARKAVTLIEDGMVVVTTGGTTIIELAKVLPTNLKATFFCGSVPAICEYMKHPNIEIIVIGDKLSKNSRITVGHQAIEQIRSLRADLCFLGINAIHPEFGVSDNDWDVVVLKKAMIKSSQKVVGLSISEKINTIQPIQLCPLDHINVLVTERTPFDPLLHDLRKKGIQPL